MAIIDEPVALYFQLESGQRADLEAVSAASIAWAQAIRAAASAIDPEAEIRLELIGANKGSMRVLTAIERRVQRLQDGWTKWPLTVRLGLGLAVFITTTGYPTYEHYFGDEGFSELEKKELSEIVAKAQSAPGFDMPKRQMFKAVEKDRKIVGVGVASGAEEPPKLIVPRSQFAERSGLWELQSDAQDRQRIVGLTLDVVLVAAQFENAPRSWTFRQEGLPPFTAIMKDKRFLDAMERNEVRERLRMKIPMTIRLEVREVFKNGDWMVGRKGQSVVEVIAPSVD